MGAGAFLVWGAVLGLAERRLICIGKTTGAAAEGTVRRIDRRRFLVQLGGTTAVITVAGAVVGEFVEARRRKPAMMTVKGEPMRWSATHPLPLTHLTKGTRNSLVQSEPGAA